jgi:hypothetical protein
MCVNLVVSTVLRLARNGVVVVEVRLFYVYAVGRVDNCYEVHIRCKWRTCVYVVEQTARMRKLTREMK